MDQHEARTTPLPIPPDGLAQAYFGSWLGEAARGVVIVRRDLSVVWANACAHRLQSVGVSLKSGSLSICDAATTASLRMFVAELNGASAGWAGFVCEGEHIVIRADPTAPQGLDPAIVLTIRLASEAESHIVWADLRKAFGLTKAEATIVKRLLGGSGADSIAAETSVTLDTIRTHIRRVYLKLGVSSREQLFAKLLRFRLD